MRRRGGRRAVDLADLTVLRFVPGDGPLHRLDARVKVVGITAVTLALAISADWPSALVALGGSLVLFVVSRLPLGVLPRPPRLVWVALGVSCGLGLLGGDVAAVLLFLVLVSVLLINAGLVGWTTQPADLTPAVDWLLGPLRRVRAPVDELVAALSLAVRSLPLVLEELRTLTMAYRARPPVSGAGVAGWRRWPELIAAVVTVSVRRAQELGTALEARGGLHPPLTPRRWNGAGRLTLLVAVSWALLVGWV